MSEPQSSLVLREKFEYESLDLTKQQIRLLTLHPASAKEDPVECSLEAFDTDNCPKYVALSYVWGPASPTQTILVNQQSFTVRQNLYDFLLAYRNDDNNKIYIWIDQICISQAHTGERNHQVKLMSVIYSNSLSTLSWLGFEYQETASQFNALCQSDEHDYRMFALLKKFLGGEYFNRLWVMQEIILAPRTFMLCGDEWLELQKLLWRTGHYKDTSVFESSRSDIGLTQALTKPYGYYSLTDFIRWFCGKKCVDPRDKVYGLMGLVHQELVIDYDRSIFQVFIDVVAALVQSGTLVTDWEIFEILLFHMGLEKQIGAFHNIWLDLRDNHMSANPEYWSSMNTIHRTDPYNPEWRDREARGRLSLGWADTSDEDSYDEKGHVIPYYEIGHNLGRDEMSDKWWFTWRGITWFYVVGDWQDPGLLDYYWKNEEDNIKGIQFSLINSPVGLATYKRVRPSFASRYS